MSYTSHLANFHVSFSNLFLISLSLSLLFSWFFFFYFIFIFEIISSIYITEINISEIGIDWLNGYDACYFYTCWPFCPCIMIKAFMIISDTAGDKKSGLTHLKHFSSTHFLHSSHALSFFSSHLFFTFFSFYIFFISKNNTHFLSVKQYENIFV